MRMFDNIRRWAAARNLIQGSSPDRQLVKLEEEMQELAEAIAAWNTRAAAPALKRGVSKPRSALVAK